MNSEIHQEIFSRAIRNISTKIASNLLSEKLVPVTPLSNANVTLVYPKVYPKIDYSRLELEILIDKSKHLINYILEKHCK